MTLLPAAEAIDRFSADLDALIGDHPGGVGLAVSGGADSLALLLLGHAALAGRVRAATVDHELRPEAADEAAFVATVSARLGVEHDILRPAEPIVGNIQSSARRARYSLLEEWRLAHRLDWLVTAHHADDQAETLLMRLNRGSGVGGLSAIRAVNGVILRPLLGWRRAELEAIVSQAGIEPVDDPSNRDERFDRVRMRRQLAQADWIEPLGLARSAAALAEAEEALNWAAERFWDQRSTSTKGSVQLDLDEVPPELRRRLVYRALQTLRPGLEVRGGDLSRFISALETGGCSTLAGVKGEGALPWRFTLAPERRVRS